MRVILSAVLIVAAGASGQGVPAGQAASTQASPAAQAALDKIISEVQGEPTVARLNEVLRLVEQMEKDHPKARQIHLARMLGIRAATGLARMHRSAEGAEKVRSLSRRVLGSDAPGQMKVYADAYAVMLEIKPPKGAATRPAGRAGKAIRGLVARHGGSSAVVDALMIAITLAEAAGDDGLVEQFEKTLRAKHSDDPKVKRMFLYRGKPFAASLTRLDGSKLNLPKDLLGKVVVIDFWATWCPPCIASLPHMKQVYARYRGKGVEIIGVSLDRRKGDLVEFLKTNDLPWIHTCSGMYWDDPTARRYGISGIPAMWVIGKDGKVFSDKARGRLERILDKALKARPEKAPAPTTRPAKATKPAAKQ